MFPWVRLLLLLYVNDCLSTTGPLIVKLKQGKLSSFVPLRAAWNDIRTQFPGVASSQILVIQTPHPVSMKLLLKQKDVINMLEQYSDQITMFPSIIEDGHVNSITASGSNMVDNNAAMDLFKQSLNKSESAVLFSTPITSGRSRRQVTDNTTTTLGRVHISSAYLHQMGSNNQKEKVLYNPVMPAGMDISNSSLQLDLVSSEDSSKKIQLVAQFSQGKRYWYLDNSTLIMIDGSYPLVHFACGSMNSMKTPLDKSYCCYSARFDPQSNDAPFFRFELNYLELQPYNYAGQFGKCNDCACWMTTVMWIGLSFILLFFLVIYWALSYVGRIEGPIKFHDPGAKMIPIPDK